MNGGGPAGGGVPGGVRKNLFTWSSVLPGASFTMIISWTCVPTFLIATVPVPVNDASGRNVNSLSEMLPPSAFGVSSTESAVCTTLTSPTMPCAACDLPSLSSGMKQATPYSPGSRWTVAVTDAAGIDVVRPADELDAGERLDVGRRRGGLERGERHRSQLREGDLVTLPCRSCGA